MLDPHEALHEEPSDRYELQDRGVRVVVISFPVCGRRREIERSRYPRKQFWEVFAARTSAITIRSEDSPELQDYTCRDGSHLDKRDTPRFTRALRRIVDAKLREHEQAIERGRGAPCP